MARVTIRYWAAAKDAAGVAEESLDALTLSDALVKARRRHSEDSRFAAVLDRSSFLVDGTHVGRRAAAAVILPQAAVIEVLPAFAGG
jgi:molybdopterin synthase sulfur carrier subunit